MQDLVTTMVVAKYLVDYRRSEFFKDKGLENSHAMSGEDEVSPSATK